MSSTRPNRGPSVSNEGPSNQNQCRHPRPVQGVSGAGPYLVETNVLQERMQTPSSAISITGQSRTSDETLAERLWHRQDEQQQNSKDLEPGNWKELRSKGDDVAADIDSIIESKKKK